MSDVTSRAWWRWESMVGAIVTDYGPGVRIVSVSKDYIHGSAVEASTSDLGPVWMRLRKERCSAVSETDPATLGCLTQRARDLWGEPRLHLVPTITGGWRVAGFTRAADDVVGAHGPTEYAALLAACDAAPVNTTTKDTP